MQRPSLLTLFLQLILATCVVFLLHGWLSGFELQLPFTTEDQLAFLSLPLEQLQEGLFVLPVEADFPVYEKLFNAGEWLLSPRHSRWFLWGWALGLSFLLALLVSMKTPQLVGASLVAVLFYALASFQVLKLQLPFSSNIPVVALCILMPALLWWMHKRPAIWSFPKRFGLLFALHAGLLAFIEWKSAYPFPLAFVAHFSFWAPLALALMFVFLLSAQIPYALLALTGRSDASSSQSNIKHFSWLSLLYLLNLGLLLAQHMHWFSTDLVLIHTNVWLLIALVAGFFFIDKSPAWQKICPSPSLSKPLYLTLAIISFGVQAYAYQIGDAALQNAFQVVVLLSFSVFGLTTWMYVVINYRGSRHAKLFEVVYQDESKHVIPNYLARGIAFFIITMLVYMGYLTPINRIKAAYYALIGDSYLLNHEADFAATYYGASNRYNSQNPHVHYALASIELMKQNIEGYLSALFYNMENNPLEQSFLKVANKYAERQLPIQVIEKIKEGIQLFPRSERLYNNLALAYAHFGLADSAIVSLEKARQLGLANDMFSTNLFAVLSRHPQGKGSLPHELLGKTEDPAALANAYLAALRVGDSLSIPFQKQWFEDSTLSYPEAIYLASYTLAHLNSPNEPASFSYIEKSLLQSEWRQQFGHELLLAKALYLYYGANRCSTAFQALRGATQSGITHAPLLAAWYLEHGNYPKAAETVGYAARLGQAKAQLTLALALSAQGKQQEALPWWTLLAKQQAPELAPMQTFLNAMPQVLQATAPDTDWEEWKIFAFLYYRNDLDIAQLRPYLDWLSSPEYKLWAQYHWAERLLTAGKLQEAGNFLPEPPAALQAPWLHSLYAQLTIRQAAESGQTKRLEGLIERYRNQMAPFDRLYLFYARGMLTEARQQTEEALQWYRRSVEALPFYAPAYLRAVDLLNAQGKEMDAYNLLINGLRQNETSVALSKAYALQALRIGAFSYAEQELEHLQNIMPAKEFEAFRAIYEKQQAFLEQRTK
ncbi:tetratricopeptide repeat protein [Thermonema rossianum]|uniref:tetratricopeptide repeat protein n=1 Tax=Thermonema rossianum TaxID=55505 RepID=UPI0012F9ABDA|nr:hypothetical protein [Thermonema rossianum]